MNFLTEGWNLPQCERLGTTVITKSYMARGLGDNQSWVVKKWWQRAELFNQLMALCAYLCSFLVTLMIMCLLLSLLGCLFEDLLHDHDDDSLQFSVANCLHTFFSYCINTMSHKVSSATDNIQTQVESCLFSPSALYLLSPSQTLFSPCR